jgi:hypothetical protein
MLKPTFEGVPSFPSKATTKEPVCSAQTAFETLIFGIIGGGWVMVTCIVSSQLLLSSIIID